jgi:hypothetical protein
METERGCGWRVAGGVYLVCDGFGAACDLLPVPLTPCECCGFTVNHARSMQPIAGSYLAGQVRGHKCNENFLGCPMCYYATTYPLVKAEAARLAERLSIPWADQTEEMRNENADLSDKLLKLKAELAKPFYLMFVSKDFYSPENFIKEANEQGISKRVAPNSLPKGFTVGKDYVFLAHQDVKLKDGKRGTAVFYGFLPMRLELVLYKGTNAETIREYEEAGYTVVLLERTKENLERHGSGRNLPPLPYGFKPKNKTKKGKGEKTKVKTKTKNKMVEQDPPQAGRWGKGEL